MAGSPCPFPTNQPGCSGQLSAGSNAESMALKLTHRGHLVSQGNPSRALSTYEHVSQEMSSLQAGHKSVKAESSGTMYGWGLLPSFGEQAGSQAVHTSSACGGTLVSVNRALGLYHEFNYLAPLLVWTGQLGCLLCTLWIAFSHRARCPEGHIAPVGHTVLRRSH